MTDPFRLDPVAYGCPFASAVRWRRVMAAAASTPDRRDLTRREEVDHDVNRRPLFAPDLVELPTVPVGTPGHVHPH